MRDVIGTTGPGGKFDSTGNRETVIRHREQARQLLEAIGTAGYAKASATEQVFLDDCRFKMKGSHPTFGWRQVDYLKEIKARVSPSSAPPKPSSRSTTSAGHAATRSPNTGH